MLTIDARFNGPPESANGGYTCGMLGNFVAGAAEVTLRKPPPLAKPLAVVHGESGLVRLVDGDTVVAEAKPASLDDLIVPALPGRDDVVAASQKYIGFHAHLYPHCFVCGPARRPNEGLRIFAGPTATTGVVAAPWTPDETLGDEHGVVRPEFLWAALDCPGYFSDVAGDQMFIALLGRLSATIVNRVTVGEACTVLGWRIAREGRKHIVGTAVFDAAGRLCAKGRGVWIELQ